VPSDIFATGQQSSPATWPILSTANHCISSLYHQAMNCYHQSTRRPRYVRSKIMTHLKRAVEWSRRAGPPICKKSNLIQMNGFFSILLFW
jgi:hypothetical protein